jgi:flagellar motor switch protein FliG
MAETAVATRPGRPRGLEKAAILLLTLGPEAAAEVFKHLAEEEVRQVSAAIARLRSIPHAHAAAVHEEAWRRLTDRDGLLVDGEQFASQVISDVLSGGRGQLAHPSRDVKRVTQTSGDFLASSLEPVPPAMLAQVLGNEHPQVIAVILANLRAKHAAQVLGALPEALQGEIVHRIAELQSVPEDLLAEVGDALQGLVQGLGRSADRQVAGGAKLAAAIMNVADDTLEARIFTHLDSAAPELAETIRASMFTFEDLVGLDNRGMQVVLKEVAREDLMLALKTASPAMRDKIFGNLSQRAAEILKDDMSTMGPVKLKDVEKAQTNIVGVARRLESEQKITIGGVGGDDVIA